MNQEDKVPTSIKIRFILCCLVTLIACSGHDTLVRKSERIIFLGDSITKGGEKPNGYVTLISETLSSEFADWGIEVIGAGISGNKVPDLQARLEKDVLERKPTLVVIYIGINDVWHWRRSGGTPKDIYETGLRDIVGRIRSAGANVVLCTPSVIGEKTDGSNQFDAMLEEYSAISRRVAGETGSTLCDLRKAFLGYLSVNNSANQEKGVLTTDGVHLNDAGNRFVADEILKILKGTR